MHVMLVHIRVKPEKIEAFQQAILDNAKNSMLEPGVVRFDVYQQKDDPTRFTLVEIYRAAEELLKHRETAHYLRWREVAADMMAEDRVAVSYVNMFPGDADWS